MATVTLTADFTGTAALTGSPAGISITPTGPFNFAGEATFDAPLPKAKVLRLAFRGTSNMEILIPRGYVVDASTGRPQYRVVLLDAASGDPVGELQDVAMEPLSTALDALGTFSWSMAATDAKAALIRPNLTEVQLWRGGQLEWWGVIIRASEDGITLRVQAVGLGWYLSRRTIGKIPKDDLIVNGSFEDGEFGWSFSWVPGSQPAVPPIHAISDDALTGSTSLSITGASATVTAGLLSSVLFEPDTATFVSGGEAAVAAVAATMPNPAGEVLVVGHSANDGSGGNGLGLSLRRAEAVAKIIEANTTGATITTRGVGYYDPDPNYAVSAAEQRRVVITYTGIAKGNKQFAGQSSFYYTNPSEYRKMPLTLVGWFKVLEWVEPGIGYGVDLELVDKAGTADPLTGLFDKNSSVVKPALVETVKLLGYRINADGFHVTGWAASDETSPASLATARGAAVAAILSSVSPYTITSSGGGVDGISTTTPDGCTFTGTIDKVETGATVQMDASTPKNAWTRQEATIEVPADGREFLVNVRLFPPQGTVLWDSVHLTEGTVLGFYDDDQADIVAGLIEHAQDESMGKSDLRLGARCPKTRIKRTREYAWSDRKPVTEALAEFPTLYDGMDWDVQYSASQRWVQTWFPRRGQDKSYALVLGSNVVTYTRDLDGEQTASTVVVQATNGSGSGREEGVKQDADPLDGIVLERVYQAPTDSSVGTLDAQAETGWARYSRPVVIPKVVCHPGYTTELLNRVSLGDRVRLVIDRGLVDTDAKYRVTGVTLDPTNDQLSYQLAEE